MNRLMGFFSVLFALLAAFLYQKNGISLTPLHFLALSGSALAADSRGDWHLFQHLGGNSPWIQREDDHVQNGTDLPMGCRVDQVHMLSRHAERYPTLKAGIRMLQLYQRLSHLRDELQGDLAFFKDWDFFIPDPSTALESLVPVGPYAGTLEAFSTGVKLRTTYAHLRETSVERNQTSFWASGSPRVVATAKYFASGFYGIDWDKHAALHIIPETADLGADTLTPGDTCKDYADNADAFGHDYGYRMHREYQLAYLPTAVERLEAQNPGIRFTIPEVYVMQEMCGFETIAKGSSPWCDVFTRDEWLQFEYARDLLHFYRSGPGNKYGALMGWLYLNATATLLARESWDVGSLFFSFAHDGDIIPLVAALDLFPQTEPLPATHALHERAWRTSAVTPMGGRIVFERLACPDTKEHCWSPVPMYPNMVYCGPSDDEEIHVRVRVNDGVAVIPGCQSGPGGSCPLAEFVAMVAARGEELGDFRERCGLEDTAPDRITFLHH